MSIAILSEVTVLSVKSKATAQKHNVAKAPELRSRKFRANAVVATVVTGSDMNDCEVSQRVFMRPSRTR